MPPQAGFCTRCGEPAHADATDGSQTGCDRTERPGAALDPPRYCTDCGARLTLQVTPTGYAGPCLRCERRARFAAAG